MRLERKELILFVIALFPAFAGLAISDPWVFFTCFSISWIASIVLCVVHDGWRTLRILAGILLTAFFILVGWRAYIGAQRSESVLNAISRLASKPTGTLNVTPEVNNPEPPAEGPPDELASVEFRSHILSPPPAHQLNTILGGITWREYYADLRLDITNGPIPIQNLDIKIALDNDQGIAALGQLSDFPAVTIFPAHDMLPGGRDGQPSAPTGLRIINEDGTVSPDDPFKEDSVQRAYRIHCDNVFPESTLRFIIASVPLDETKTNLPQSIHIVGSYDTKGLNGLQTHPIEITRTFSQ